MRVIKYEIIFEPGGFEPDPQRSTTASFYLESGEIWHFHDFADVCELVAKNGIEGAFEALKARTVAGMH